MYSGQTIIFITSHWSSLRIEVKNNPVLYEIYYLMAASEVKENVNNHFLFQNRSASFWSLQIYSENRETN